MTAVISTLPTVQVQDLSSEQEEHICVPTYSASLLAAAAALTVSVPAESKEVRQMHWVLYKHRLITT